ncbi:MAG TPA: hypothetical protein DHW02_07860 [Ktedonobacter sp.]|nr:hypothetical protein [Ktedonobacter sp.]
MRQGTGTDVLGLNDPRNGRIGVIYVSANDENSYVINAIQGQDRLGRKQVAVVLAEQHKAFQHPEDFDALKRLRNSLSTQVVFIVPGGLGPAEFARQRRFSVYSSLENYTKALHDEQSSKKAHDKEMHRGWFFARRKLSDAPLQEETSSEPIALSTASEQSISPENSEERDSKAPITRMRPIIIGGAEAVTPMATIHSGRVDSDVFAHIRMQEKTPVESDEETAVVSKGGPAIIDLQSTRTRSKETVRLSDEDAPAVLPIAVGGVPLVAVREPTVQSGGTLTTSSVSRQSGKVAAMGAGGAKSANRSRGGRAAGTLAATSLANTATGGTPPPTMNRGGGGGGGGGGRRGAIILGLIALLVLTGGVVSAIAYSQPGLLNSLKHITNVQGTSTITITPASKTESNNYIIIGVQGTPDSTKQQISARAITGTSPSQSKTVSATGQKQTAGVAATGTLMFINSLPQEQTVRANTVFTGKDGVQIVNSVAANIPAANPIGGVFGKVTVSAHAVQVGTGGNISASDIAGYCCTTDKSISVVNAAFSGGQNPQNYTFVQQSDIDGAVNALEPSLLQQAETSLKGQVHSNEQLAGSVTCTPAIGQNQNAGDKASSVTVTVSVTCKGVAYDQKGALSLVTSLLSKQATKDLGSNYALVGNIVTSSQVQKVTSSGVSLLVNAKGVWVYQFSSSVQQNLKNLIAGKNVTDAITLLKSQPGISDVSINPNTGTLPTNISNITFVIQAVAGLSGGGSSSGGASMTPTVTGPGGSGLTPLPGNG